MILAFEDNRGRERRDSFLPLSLIIVLLLHFQTSAATDTGSYTFKISHPVTVGTKYHYISTTSQKVSSNVIAAGKAPVDQKRDSRVELDGIIEVLAVDSKGSETKMACTVNRCETIQDAARTAVIPKGSVIIVEAVPKGDDRHQFGTSYSLVGGSLTPEQMAVIGNAIAAKLPEAPTDQEIWGTEQPQKVGGSWALDRGKGAAFLSRMGITVDPSHLSGQSRLSGIETFSGKKCLRVESNVSSQKFGVTLPPGVSLERSSVAARLVTLVPVDGASMTQSTSDATVDIVAKGNNPEAGAFTAHNSAETHQVIEIRPIDKEERATVVATPVSPASMILERADYKITLPKDSVVKPPGKLGADRLTTVTVNDHMVHIVVVDDKARMDQSIDSTKSGIVSGMKQPKETASDLFNSRSGKGQTVIGKIEDTNFRLEIGAIPGKKKAFVIVCIYPADEVTEMTQILKAAINSFTIKGQN